LNRKRISAAALFDKEKGDGNKVTAEVTISYLHEMFVEKESTF
jgi:hypothetical protein